MKPSAFLANGTIYVPDSAPSQFVFRLSALEEQFRCLYPTDDFGHCLPFVDRYVLQYPQLFRSQDEFDNEGIAIRIDEEAKFSIPGCCDESEQKIRRVLKFVFARIVVDGHGDVVASAA
ncbi:hypothetical protein [Caballeronia cordobensis]|uniref:hypothetical protein n=1 Tax=Caballeronia cordobensis TaxID=1353886 RepID=UPI0006AD74A8|nr:hypothetical protein [Caballeronia cordobensis]